jgi:agmatinase
MALSPTLLGIPWDGYSSHLRGAAGGPAAIRAALRSESSNDWNEDLMDVAALLNDAGDVALTALDDPIAAIEARVASLPAEVGPIILGGDHSITWPVIRAIRRRFPRLTILHLDAHPDLYDSFDGDRRSHACPFARVMEERLCDRLIQLGIRTLNPHQRQQAERFGVEMVQMRQGLEAMQARVASITGPVYLSLDLDVLDPAFAPGLSHPESGGLSTRELLGILHAIPRGTLIGADIVELNPLNDLRDLTARVGAKCVKEVVGKLQIAD